MATKKINLEQFKKSPRPTNENQSLRKTQTFNLKQGLNWYRSDTNDKNHEEILEEIKRDTLVIDFKTLKTIKADNKYKKLYKGEYLFEYGDKNHDIEDKDLIIDESVASSQAEQQKGALPRYMDYEKNQKKKFEYKNIRKDRQIQVKDNENNQKSQMQFSRNSLGLAENLSITNKDNIQLQFKKIFDGWNDDITQRQVRPHIGELSEQRPKEGYLNFDQPKNEPQTHQDYIKNHQTNSYKDPGSRSPRFSIKRLNSHKFNSEKQTKHEPTEVTTGRQRSTENTTQKRSLYDFNLNRPKLISSSMKNKRIQSSKVIPRTNIEFPLKQQKNLVRTSSQTKLSTSSQMRDFDQSRSLPKTSQRNMSIEDYTYSRLEKNYSNASQLFMNKSILSQNKYFLPCGIFSDKNLDQIKKQLEYRQSPVIHIQKPQLAQKDIFTATKCKKFIPISKRTEEKKQSLAQKLQLNCLNKIKKSFEKRLLHQNFRYKDKFSNHQTNEILQLSNQKFPDKIIFAEQKEQQ